MKQDSYLSQSFKIGIIIFIPLAILISLFPPFYWDIPSNRKDVHHYNSIKDLLPLKKYSLIFDSNKKLQTIGTNIFGKKYYQSDSIKLKKVLADAIEIQFWEGMDTIYKYEPVAYEIKNKNSQSEFIFRYKRNNYNYGNRFETKEDIIKRAKNYDKIKEKYLKDPDGWDYRFNKIFASLMKYYQYTIRKPNYYLLQRSLIISELFVNYLLAFFVSIGIGLIIKKFRP